MDKSNRYDRSFSPPHPRKWLTELLKEQKSFTGSLTAIVPPPPPRASSPPSTSASSFDATTCSSGARTAVQADTEQLEDLDLLELDEDLDEEEELDDGSNFMYRDHHKLKYLDSLLDDKRARRM